jgi:hypothetical protein
VSARLRPIDHCVLPTADLAVARARLTALGFTVAPYAMHPFGTANCCVFFADGSYLEPLAVVDPAKAAIASRDGNVFTARDAAYRDRVGQEGFCGLVFGTNDADADHRDFVAAGISAGAQLAFSRPFVDASGHEDTASFKLAFAADPSSPNAFFFACERVNAPAVDRSALQKHANGVRRIKAVILEAPEPSDFAEFMQQVAGVAPTDTPEGLCFRATNGDIHVRRSPESRLDQGLRLVDIVFGVDDVRSVATLLTATAVAFDEGAGRISVVPVAGQGAAFVFEGLGVSRAA